MRGSIFLAVALLVAPCLAAPAPIRTALPLPLAERDGNVNVDIQIGAISPVVITQTKVIKKTATVTSTINGSPTPCVVTEEVSTLVVVTSTATAYATKIVSETVVEGTTIPVTFTTTGYDVDIETAMVTIQQTSTFYTAQQVVVTVQGEPVTSTSSVLVTAVPSKTAQQNEPAETPTDEEEAPPSTKTKSAAVLTITSVATSTDAAGSSIISTLTTTQPSTNNVNVNGSANADADADSNSGASLNATNTNTNDNDNSVSINWIDEGSNKNYIIIGSVVLGVGLIGIIIAIIVSSCSSKSSGGGNGAPTVVYGPTGGSGELASRPQSINMSQTPAQPATVAASLARKPGRSAKKQYNRLEDASSEGEMSSGQSSGIEGEDAAEYERRARQPAAGSARSGSGRSRSNSMASLGHARSSSRSGHARSSSRASVSRSASRSSRR